MESLRRSAQYFAVASRRLVLPAPGDETMFTMKMPRRVNSRRRSCAACFAGLNTSWPTGMVLVLMTHDFFWFFNGDAQQAELIPSCNPQMRRSAFRTLKDK